MQSIHAKYKILRYETSLQVCVKGECGYNGTYIGNFYSLVLVKESCSEAGTASILMKGRKRTMLQPLDEGPLYL